MIGGGLAEIWVLATTETAARLGSTRDSDDCGDRLRLLCPRVEFCGFKGFNGFDGFDGFDGRVSKLSRAHIFRPCNAFCSNLGTFSSGAGCNFMPTEKRPGLVGTTAHRASLHLALVRSR